MLVAGKTSMTSMEKTSMEVKLSLKVVLRGGVSPPPLVEVNQASISLVGLSNDLNSTIPIPTEGRTQDQA